MPVNQFRSLLAEFLQWLSPAFIHIHSVAGLDWQSTTSLFDLIRETRAPYYISLHDYAAFCHRYNLVQPGGRYCGLAELDVCRACVKSDRNYPEAIDPAVRRETFARFLEGASCVFAPSRDIKARFEAAGVRYAIELRPHDEEPIAAPVCTPPKQPETFNIVILGAIGLHKGSRIVLALARDAKARHLPIRYHIVGYSDTPVEMEAAGVTETGPYAEADEAFAHIVEAKPSCIFLPSIWPETYCYTLSMAFALQCPPVVFDIGAQAERIREKGFGVILPYDLMFNIKALNNRFIEMHDLA